jgi:hypothetical protein
MYITQKTFADLVDQVVTITDAQNAEIAAIKDKLNGGNGHAAMDEHLLVAHVRNLQHQINKMDDRLARQDETIAALLAKDKLTEGVLPEMGRLTLLEVQVFYKDFRLLTPAQLKRERQARHTEWSVRVTASVGGRRFGGKGEINVGLYDGSEFAQQVLNTGNDIPEAIRLIAEAAQRANDPDVLFGMFNRQTSGAGTPRSRDHFIVLQGHLQDRPEVEVWSYGKLAKMYECRPGAGTRKGHAKWYCKCKPTL